MIVIAQVRLTNHILGELKPDDRGIRRFRMNDRQQIYVNQTQWLDDMVFSAHSLKLGINVRKTITPPSGIVPASIHLYRRVYSGVRVEFFESLRKGAILTFELVLQDQLPKCPTLEQLKQILSMQGEYCGISQWGSKFGFGRFVVVEVRDRFSNNAPPPESDETPVESRSPG